MSTVQKNTLLKVVVPELEIPEGLEKLQFDTDDGSIKVKIFEQLKEIIADRAREQRDFFHQKPALALVVNALLLEHELVSPETLAQRIHELNRPKIRKTTPTQFPAHQQGETK